MDIIWSCFWPSEATRLLCTTMFSLMLNQVMQGYNCTLSPMDKQAPGRHVSCYSFIALWCVLQVYYARQSHLFHQLETTATDYSVKISFIELYNEELRNFLAAKLSAPARSTQPMGKGSNSNLTDANQGGLKIFDDGSKRVQSSRISKKPSWKTRRLHWHSHQRQPASTDCCN
jgi:kinesin family protein 11